jgi:hypothetical protein
MQAAPGQSLRRGIVTIAEKAHRIHSEFAQGEGFRNAVELIAGFIALLAAAVLSQFGVDIHSPPKADREVHRTADCRAETPASTLVSEAKRDC